MQCEGLVKERNEHNQEAKKKVLTSEFFFINVNFVIVVYLNSE